MKFKLLTFAFLAFSLSVLAGCSDERPMTEAEMAEKYGMTMEEYEQAKEDAAAMNMTVEQHMAEGHHDEDDMDMMDK